MRWMKWPLLVGLGVSCPVEAQDASPHPQGQGEYVNDFEKAEAGGMPQEMMVLAGEFTVAQEGGNKFLLLPGSPLESFGVLVGPEQARSCGARIRAKSSGKRTPEFGVGLGGAAGYKLWIMPAVNEIQIIKGEEVVARAPYAWTSGAWTVMRVQASATADGKLRVEGKAWAHGQPEARSWLVSVVVADSAPKGRASVWGTPYSDTPIAFDDVTVVGGK